LKGASGPYGSKPIMGKRLVLTQLCNSMTCATVSAGTVIQGS
jgi:hypothetical protein